MGCCTNWWRLREWWSSLCYFLADLDFSFSAFYSGLHLAVRNSYKHSLLLRKVQVEKVEVLHWLEFTHCTTMFLVKRVWVHKSIGKMPWPQFQRGNTYPFLHEVSFHTSSFCNKAIYSSFLVENGDDNSIYGENGKVLASLKEQWLFLLPLL